MTDNETRHTVDADEVGVDTSPIVAYACDECETAIEINFLDEHIKVVGTTANLLVPLEQCPLCQGTKLSPLTQAEYDAVYQDDGSDEYDPSQRERI